MSANTPQPPPRLGNATPTMALVRADLEERALMGLAKYGTPHQADNGRDHLIDLYQELLDACVYARAEIERRKTLADDNARLRGLVKAAAIGDSCPWCERWAPGAGLSIEHRRSCPAYNADGSVK